MQISFIVKLLILGFLCNLVWDTSVEASRDELYPEIPNHTPHTLPTRIPPFNTEPEGMLRPSARRNSHVRTIGPIMDGLKWFLRDDDYDEYDEDEDDDDYERVIDNLKREYSFELGHLRDKIRKLEKLLSKMLISRMDDKKSNKKEKKGKKDKKEKFNKKDKKDKKSKFDDKKDFKNKFF